MEHIIMGVVIDLRSKNAQKVQEVLTKHGCIIKTRLGLHEVSESECTEHGLVILSLMNKPKEIDDLKAELLSIDGVRVNVMNV